MVQSVTSLPVGGADVSPRSGYGRGPHMGAWVESARTCGGFVSGTCPGRYRLTWSEGGLCVERAQAGPG